MSWQYTPYALGSLATALVSAGLAVYVLQRLGTPGAKMVTLYMVAVTVWGASYAVGLSSTGLAVNLFWSKVEYVGIVALPVAWVGFAAEYAGMERWLTGRNLALLGVMPLVTLALVFTNETHHLYWSETAMDPSGPFVALDVTYGPGCWAWIAYSYALLLAGAVLVVSTLARSETLYTRQGGVLLFGVAAPWLGNAVYVFGLSPIPDLDLTPYFLLLTGAAVVWAIPQVRLFDVVPVARASVVEGMEDGVIVLDSRNRVLDINPAASPVSEVPVSQAIGRALDFSVTNEEILRLANEPNGASGQVKVGGGGDRRDYEVTVSALPRHRRREKVRLLVVRDVTERVGRGLLFRLLVENASDMIAIYDTSGTPRYVSPSIDLLSSVTNAAQLYAEPGRREEFSEAMRERGAVSGFEAEVRRKDGGTAWVSVGARALREASGRIIGYEGSMENITGRIEARRTLERRVAALTRLASNLTAGQPVESTLDAVTVGVTEETAALACSVTLLDQETGKLLLVAARNLPEGYTDALGAAWGAGGRPLVGGPLESLKPGFVRGARGMFLEEPLYSPLHPFLWEAAWEGVFVVPLVSRGQALGVISAYYPPGGGTGRGGEDLYRGGGRPGGGGGGERPVLREVPFGRPWPGRPEGAAEDLPRAPRLRLPGPLRHSPRLPHRPHPPRPRPAQGRGAAGVRALPL